MERLFYQFKLFKSMGCLAKVMLHEQIKKEDNFKNFLLYVY